jgi:hypothetical protein
MPTPAPYELEFTDKGHFLLANGKGHTPLPEIIIGMWEEIGRECAKTGHTRLLYLDSFQHKATLEAVSELVNSPVIQLLSHVTIAVASKSNRLEHEFGVYLAQQKGLNIRFFHSFADAEEWLLRCH